MGIAHFNLKQLAAACAAFEKARELNPQQPQIALKLAETYLHGAQFEEAYKELNEIESRFTELFHKDWFKLGLLHHQLNQEEKALTCFKRASDAEPQNIDFAYNHALTLKNCGFLEQAKQSLRNILNKHPGHVEAWHALVLLEKALPGHNHLTQLHNLSKGGSFQSGIRVQFSLAKSFEDLGEFDKAFEQLNLANKARREQQRYEVASDIRLMRQLQNTFSASQEVSSVNSSRPIFIVSLPRSGSTLLERILTQPANVKSAGELLHFSAILGKTVNEEFGQPTSQEMFIENAARSDVQRLGTGYLAATDRLAENADFLVDKMPLNFLNVGLIRNALPQAKIIYIRRYPIDNVVAIYKTLFEQAYPYAYCLEDIAQYLVSERQLMQYWQTQYPQQLFSVNYEALVQDTASVASELFEFCEIPFQAEYLTLSNNHSASATASAAQVRNGIHRSSVAIWRQYEKHLTPAINILRNNGLI